MITIPTAAITLAARQVGDTATNTSLTFGHLARLLMFPSHTLKLLVILVSLLRTISLSKADFRHHVHLFPLKSPFRYLPIHSLYLRYQLLE